MSAPTAAPRSEAGEKDPVASQPNRRNAELLLLTIALAIGLFAYANVDLAMLGTLPPNFLVVAGIMVLLLGGAHLAVRFLAPFADPILLPAAAVLNMLGLAMIHRLDLADEQRAVRNNTNIPSPDVVPQLTWTALALVLFVTILFVVHDHRRLQKYTYTAMVLGIILLMLPLVPGLGTTVNGANLWIRLGPLSFQPSELAKIVLAVFFAGYLVTTRDSLALVRRKVAGIGLPRGRDLGPILVVWLACVAVLIFQRDLGTALMFFGLFVSLLYVSTQRRSWIIIGGVLAIIGVGFAYFSFGYVRQRFEIWLDTWSYANDQGYQIAQSLFGLANGGMLGTGWGQGYPDFVPFAKTDFITAALGEELGVTGLMAILVVYAVIVERGLRTAIACRDPFGKLLAVGFATVIGLQLFVVVGGVTRLIPLTGLTTPFLSYGGSALVANWMMIALLIRISDRARRPLPAGTVDVGRGLG
ncbi:MAG: FtsW/RodA/SpoVE family cell cycle protein [Actinobacteria bacterium]|nr:FtsW/RodA/SpoVE family cell cycle protein [Actinomycetota bacterium]